MGLIKLPDAEPPPLFGKFVILVGCGKSKRAIRSPARDLYTGSLTRMSVKWAERNSDRWFILSAKFGALDPDRKVEPYNVKMSDLKRPEREKWGEKVREFNLENDLSDSKFVVLAGSDYLKAIGFTKDQIVYAPMDGLKMGERMAWLKNNPILTKSILKGSRWHSE